MTVEPAQCLPRSLSLQYGDLLSERENLGDRVGPAEKDNTDGGKGWENEFELEITVLPCRNVTAAVLPLKNASC